ncbi:hypothetical protein B0H63DRAFT_542349 [Podospora didyma]|uniref:CYTH domain-containing protein n=1 Tax=Podospora didyma TaxID=330526 RepID=A0AAE0U263_9PEZI|nr:hypothetical protein B0H63DRAFT_542349 [Podospora didyma]
MLASTSSLLNCVLTSSASVIKKFRSLAVRDLAQEHGHYGTPKKRSGQWEAKIRYQGGDFINSRFEELTDVGAIAARVKRITGVEATAADDFGLSEMAAFTTHRETWIANDDFHIVLDTMDFGHEIGEAELQQVLARGINGEPPTEEEKQLFMRRYSWAFTPGQPTGKLTAYFERMRGKQGR